MNSAQIIPLIFAELTVSAMDAIVVPWVHQPGYILAAPVAQLLDLPARMLGAVDD